MMTNATLLLLSTTFSALQLLTKFLEQCWVERLLLVPFAEPLIIPAEYMRKMSQAITNTSIQVSCLTDEMSKADMKQAIAQADAIYIPGGNTFHLLARMYEYDLLDPIRQHVANGKPYIGSSAGSNVATPNISTTNDMPITYPPSLSSLGLVPYNINPHYNEFVPLNYRGESRVDRLIEFVRYSQKPVLAIGEGAVVHVSNGKHLILASSDDILVKLFVPDPEKNNGVAIQQVSIGEDVLPKLKPYL